MSEASEEGLEELLPKSLQDDSVMDNDLLSGNIGSDSALETTHDQQKSEDLNESGNQSDEDSETVNQHAERSSPVLDDDSSASHCPDVHSSKQEAIHSSNIKDICSETQRLARKSSLSLPYHKPRQRGLLEFLNRKRASTSDGSCPSKPSPKDLPRILKVIEDRSQEAESFFASSTDVEKNECETPNYVENEQGNIEPSAPIQMVSQPNFLSDEKKLEGREGQENRQVPRPSLGNAVYSTKGHMPEKPKLCGKPGDVLQLDEDFSEPRSSNRAGVSGFVERALQQIALSSKRMSSDVKRRESNSVAVAETKQNSDCLNERKDVKGDDLTHFPIQRQQFKEALQNSISAKRAAARMRKQEESKLDNEEEAESEEEEAEEEELGFDELSDEDDEVRGEKKSKVCKKRKHIKVSDNQDGDETDVSDEEAPTDKQSTDIPSSATLAEEASEQGSLDAATPSLSFSPRNMKDANMLIPVQSSYQEGSFNELLALCSGTFAGNSGTVAGDEPNDSLDNEDNYLGASVPIDDNLAESVSKLASSDDENSQSSNLPVVNESRAPISAKRKKLLPLLLSDDEEEIDDDEEDCHSITSDNASRAELLEPTDFFDKEAELSGSEIGSDDEREDEENEWEMEEGDKEDIDEDEIREQIGRNHLKTMLDDDQREIRLFQELFLEDGDLHSDGGGRKKQFKWDASAEGFDRERTQGENAAEDQDQDAGEGPDEAAWRKAKNEREKWLQQKGMSVMLDDLKFQAKKVRIVKTKANNLRPETKDTNVDTNCLPPSPTKNDAMLKVRRGSFLRRGDKELTEIANLSKVGQPVQAPTASSNFVFASVTPKRNKTHSEKRKVKVEDAGVENHGSSGPPNKKSRIRGASASVFSFL